MDLVGLCIEAEVAESSVPDPYAAGYRVPADTPRLFLIATDTPTAGRQKPAAAGFIYSTMLNVGEWNGRRITLLKPTVFASAPDHAGLFLGVESQLCVKARAPGAEPEKFDFLESRMIEDTLDDFHADALLLVGFVDDHIPDGGTVHKIREHAAESHQLIAVPCAECDMSMAQHFFRIVERPVLSPGRLME